MIRTSLPAANSNTWGTVTYADINALTALQQAGSQVVTNATLPTYSTLNVGPGTLAGNSSITLHYGVSGAQLGQQVQASISGGEGSNWGSLMTTWTVDAANDVQLVLHNTSISSVSYGETSFFLRVA